MLMGLRKASDTWLGRIVLGLVMGVISLSFAIWGIGNIFHGFGHSTIATVGGTEISANAFRQALQAQLERLRLETKRTITPEQAHALGLDREVLVGLLAGAALTDKARSMGLALSTDQLRKLMFTDPNFRDQAGNFDSQQMSDWLRQQGYTQNDLADVYMQRQIATGIVDGLSTPRPLLEAFNRYAGEARSIVYTALPASAAGNIPAAGDAALQIFYEAHKASYKAPEYRDFVTLTVSPQSLAKPDAVSDADARELYDRVADGRFGTAERRTLQQLIFPTQAEAAAAFAKIKAGTSFVDIAKQRNLAAGDVELGKRTKNQVADVADIAFSLPQGAVSDPIKTRFGYVLVRVVDITPGNLRPFAEVAAELKKQIAPSRVKAATIEELHDKIENLRSAGKSLDEVGKAVGLAPRAFTGVDANGRDKKGAPVADPINGPALLKAVFSSDVGLVDNETLRTPDHGYQWFEVAKVEASRDRGFAEVKPEVEKAWRGAEVAKALNAKASDLYKKLDAGASLDTLIPGAKVETVNDLTRAGKAGLPSALVSSVFSTPPGLSGSVPGEADSRIVFKVTGSKVPPFDPAAPRIRQYASEVSQDLINNVLRQYAGRLEREIGSKVDPVAMRSAALGGEAVAPIDMD